MDNKEKDEKELIQNDKELMKLLRYLLLLMVMLILCTMSWRAGANI